jgi:hypothetical protein
MIFQFDHCLMWFDCHLHVCSFKSFKQQVSSLMAQMMNTICLYAYDCCIDVVLSVCEGQVAVAETSPVSVQFASVSSHSTR